ncbi:hypothetical protein ACUL41_01635 [Virgibacillus natechei]
MEYITLQRLNQIFKDQDAIGADDLVYLLEEKLDYTVSLERKPSLSKEQKRFATQRIFSEPEVIDQLKYAKENRDPELSAYSGNEEEFSRLVDKMNGR